ncbi:RNA-binding signal recognition particle subunit SRP14 Ecym_5613 [Eremothecium cymbalariae DBVPG|uniref:Signal recognition particle subunit SRP14 n=1 Tax=Eremothecium cymbalariae (strain CBS 270.75 / DBVPG 7215 / KCTC 17166 / NRRL Y-17582) TaxID=931890 RepID=I6NE57_ERECY|nr:hypothetical protein Ecym_5613 [Eremothecium cymbalariae DBVPG\
MSKSNYLPHEQLLVRLKELIDSANESHNSLNVAMKRLIINDSVSRYNEFDTNNPVAVIARKTRISGSGNKEYPLLLRVSCNVKSNKVKYHTVVEADSLDKFWQDYVALLKLGMNNLIKTKKKKSKSKSKSTGKKLIIK